MDLRQLEYFVAVAHALNFTRAAELLHVSQPPLSRQIAALERELGLPLFERSSRGVRLTPAGRTLAREARRVLDGTDAMRALAAQALARGGTVSAPLRLGVLRSALVEVVPTVLERLRTLDEPARPAVQVVCRDVSELQDELIEGHLDVVICRAFSPNARVDQRIVRRERVIAAVHTDHPLAAGPVIDLADLQNEDLAMTPRAAAPEYVDMIIAACRGRGFSPRIVHEHADYQVVLGLAASNVAVGLVPAQMRSIHLPHVAYRALVNPEIPTDIFVAQALRRPSPHFDLICRLAGLGPFVEA